MYIQLYIFYKLLVIFIPAPFHCSPTHAILLIRFFRFLVSFSYFMWFYLIFMQCNLPTTVMFLANCYYPSNYAINIISQSILKKNKTGGLEERFLKFMAKTHFHLVSTLNLWIENIISGKWEFACSLLRWNEQRIQRTSLWKHTFCICI